MMFFVDKLPVYDNWAAGVAIGPFIWIKKTHKDNKGLIAHEKFHVKMFWVFFVVFGIIAGVGYILAIQELIYGGLICALALRGLIYKFVDNYRLWEEVKAYVIQYNLNGEKLSKLKFYANAIATHYNLKITKKEALEKLQNEVNRSN